MTFGERLKHARERTKRTQKQIEKCTKISAKSLSRYETNASAPDPDTISLLTRLYDVSPAYILGFSDTLGHLNESDPSADAYSAHEKTLIAAYRRMPAMQAAVDTLLGIDDKPAAGRTVRVAAQGGGVVSHVITATDDEIRQAATEDDENFEEFPEI